MGQGHEGAICWRPALLTLTNSGFAADWEVMIDHM